jgi:DNA (cytosine-5)-methyltransferase 1
MRYLSLCSGIEAATTAWHALGWQPVAFSEIEPFPAAVLAHHWPHVPNLGDMTKWREWPEELLASVDILVGGTPCQAFSVAGLRNSLADARGNLTLTYVQILEAIDLARSRRGRPPAICVWENVPGVLNTDDNALGCFLAALAGEHVPLEPPGGRWADFGYVRGPVRAIAWRCLDAQYFGLAQRRKRVFLVAGAGEGFRPEEILSERDGLRRDSPPSRSTGEGFAPGTGSRSHWSGGAHPSLSQALRSSGGIGMSNQEIFSQQGAGLVPEVLCMATGQAGAEIGIGTTLSCNHEAPIVTDHFSFKPSHYTRGKDGSPSPVAPPLSADADKGDQDTLVCVNTGQGFWKESPAAGTLGASPRDAHENNLICVHGTQDPCTDGELAFALGRNSGQENAIAFSEGYFRCGAGHAPRADGTVNTIQCNTGDQRISVAFSCKDHGADAGEISPTLRSMGHHGSHANGGGQVAVAYSIQEAAARESLTSGPQGKGYQPDLSYTLEARPTVSKQQAVAFAQNTRDEVREMPYVGALAAEPGMKQTSYIREDMVVRRLMPVECARLQGFPDNHTDILPKGKPTPDGPQYKSYGNSMAVPVMAWIGKRIAAYFQIRPISPISPIPAHECSPTFSIHP